MTIDELKTEIGNYIYSNFNGEISGNILRDVLLDMVDYGGDGSVKNATPASAISMEVAGDNVSLQVEDAEIDLDTIVYDGKSLRTIFETNNLISFPAGFEGGLGTYTVNAGNPVITTEEADSGTHSLKCSGTTSQQIVSPAKASGSAFIASRVKIVSWASGYCGVQYGVGGETNHDGGVSGVTDGWVTKVARKDNSTSYSVYIGSFSSASLTGYVDTPVIVFDSTFDNVPSEEMFTALYEKYVTLKKGESVYGSRTIKLSSVPENQYTDEECKAAFVTAMNEKAAFIGAATATFMDASGLSWNGSAASVNDILHILIHASGIRQIAEKWGKKTYNISIIGSNARTEAIETSVASPSYDESAHPILGGKTGTITASGNVNYNLAWIAKIGDKECACVLMGDSTDARRWSDAEAIADYLGTVIPGGSATLSINAPRAAACILPNSPIMYDGVSFDLLVSKSPSVTGIPASLTKVMALILAYDYITDENEKVTIEATDIIGGSGDNLRGGDVISIRDLIYDMLLPSSNDAATALARHIGAKILNMQQ